MSRATLLLRERFILSEDVFAEIRIWRVPRAVPGSAHDRKYALALIAGGKCVLRYDNEAGKGDHRHMENGREAADEFQDADTLIADFWLEVNEWLARNRP